MEINWKKEAELQKEAYLDKTIEFLKIPSVYDESTITEGAPFGKPIAKALDFILDYCQELGFKVHNANGYAGHADYGEGEEVVGILCHIDVVPAGNDWTSEPFLPEVRNGKLYGRGSNDDKGPTMAAVFALKIIKEQGLLLNKRVRLIFGTDEENGEWTGLKKYFEMEPMPTMGFTPDAYFPIVTTEKGILSCEFTQSPPKKSSQDSDNGWILESFQAGDRLNMVADNVKVFLTGDQDPSSVKTLFEEFLENRKLQGAIEVDEERVYLQIIGISHHAMEPNKGLNAGLMMVRFLEKLHLDKRATQFIGLISTYLVDGFFGEKLNISIEDKISGKLTINPGTFNYSYDGCARIGLSIRYPVITNFDDVMERIKSALRKYNFELSTNFINKKPHHVNKDHVLVKTLQRVYAEQTGEEAELLAISGGTYGRALESGVAFGPYFPGETDTAHQKDENINLDNMNKAMAIYAQAIYELAK
ncbi:dipeptidase PepV [Virgibacillus sp. W0181]|uniref:dipeptidase PepV n=1 Tax=Virgibacillus sp. W0181 TaxID=3391581 RepID=UPI003F484366